MKTIYSLICVVVLSGCFGSDPNKTNLKGTALPAFSMQLPDSITFVHTSPTPDGKPVVLLYMATTCPYCKAQVKTITENADKFKDVQFYFVSNASIPAMKKFVDEYQLSKYANITMGKDTANFVLDHFGVIGVPFIALYTKDKKLKESHYGKISVKQIVKGTGI